MTKLHGIEQADSAATAASAAFKGTLVGSTALTLGGLSANDAAIYGGLLLALLGFALQWVYQHRRDRRDAERREEEHREHLARMSGLDP